MSVKKIAVACIMLFVFSCFAFELDTATVSELEAATVSELEAGNLVVYTDNRPEGVGIRAFFLIHQPLQAVWAQMIDLERCRRIYPEYVSIEESFDGTNQSSIDYVVKTPLKKSKYTLRRTYDRINYAFWWELEKGEDLECFSGGYKLRSFGENCTVLYYESTIKLSSAFANFFQSTFVDKFARKSLRRLIRGIERLD